MTKIVDRPDYFERVSRLNNRPEWRRRFADASRKRSHKVDEERERKARGKIIPPVPEEGA